MAKKESSKTVAISCHEASDYYRENEDLDCLYRHNPLIAPLEPLMTDEESINRLGFILKYNESERVGTLDERCLRVQKLYLLRQPLDYYYEVYLQVHGLLHNSYAVRNPFDDLSLKQIQSGCDGIEHVTKMTAVSYWPELSLVMSLFGPSGVGKTCLADRVFKNIRQVYRHHYFEGHHKEYKQIVWMRLECPAKGSPVAMEMDFFRQIDALVGTSYFQNFKNARLSADRLLSELREIAKLFNLGILVIDEIQRLFHLIKRQEARAVKGKSPEETLDPIDLLEFLIRMSNTDNIGLMFIGTGLVEHTFPASLALARRFSQAGAYDINRMGKDDLKQFLLYLFRYQYTAKKFILSDDLLQAFYDESQGIIGPCVSLYIFAQMEAIFTGEEELTSSMVHKIARRYLQPWQVALRIYRAGLDGSIQIPEINTVKPTLANFKKLRQDTVKINTSGNEVGDKQETDGENQPDPVKAIADTLATEIPPDEALAIAKIVVRKSKGNESLYELIQEALRLASKSKDKKPSGDPLKGKSEKEKSKNLVAGDLRGFSGDGDDKGSIYEKMLNAGVLKGPNIKHSDEG